MGRISNDQYNAPPWHPLVFSVASAERYQPKGFVEFDVTNAVKDWSSGVPNNGSVIRATNELDPGRDTRFASNANMDSSTHAFVLVRCSDGTNKQLQKQGGGWSIHKSSLMAFIFAFFVCTASALL